MACPMWINNRIYFISDHDGILNIYSCLSSGRIETTHCNHKEYARNATTDGHKIIYHSGLIYIYMMLKMMLMKN